MSTSSMPTLATSINYALPPLTLLLGTTGLVNGYLASTSPRDSAKLFGVPLSSTPTPTERAYVRAFGARNIASGVTLLSLMGLYGLARWDGLSVASTTIKRCVGVVVLVGTSVGLADGALIVKYADEGEGSGKDDEDARGKGAAHSLFAGVAGLIAVGWLVI